MTMRHICLVAASLAGSSVALVGAGAVEVPSLAMFDVELINTSGAADTPEELARLGQVTAQFREGLAKPDRYGIVSTDPVQAGVARGPALHSCNTCSIEAARTLGAQYAAHAWVQKVSNLILSVTLVVEDVSTGRTVYGNSVDIRSNTDDSWRRGVRYMIEEQMFRDGVRPGIVAARTP